MITAWGGSDYREAVPKLSMTQRRRKKRQNAWNQWAKLSGDAKKLTQKPRGKKWSTPFDIRKFIEQKRASRKWTAGHQLTTVLKPQEYENGRAGTMHREALRTNFLPDSDSPHSTPLFKLQTWNAHAYWTWLLFPDDPESDIGVCGICHNHIQQFCNKCLVEVDEKRCHSNKGCKVHEKIDCSIVWGECGHAFHKHCLGQWVEQHPKNMELGKCPYDSKTWVPMEPGPRR